MCLSSCGSRVVEDYAAARNLQQKRARGSKWRYLSVSALCSAHRDRPTSPGALMGGVRNKRSRRAINMKLARNRRNMAFHINGPPRSLISCITPQRVHQVSVGRLGRSLWALNSCNTLKKCHFEPQNVAMPPFTSKPCVCDSITFDHKGATRR